MATAATSLLGLALPVTGELSGTWGDTVNVSITALLDTAVAGTTTLSSDADVTLTTTTLAANQARQAIILWTAGGTATRTITVPAQSKAYIVINKTSSSQSIKIVGAGPTTGVTIVAGTAAFVVWNGVDFVTASVTSTTGILPVANGGTGVTTSTGTTNVVLSNSPTLVAPVLGTPASGTVTNLTGTASININGTVGATTATTGAFTSLTASTTLTVTGAGSIQGLTVGLGAGAVSTNTAVGVSALAGANTNTNHVAVGYLALQNNTSGGQNVAVGGEALKTNTAGSNNIGIGFYALRLNTVSDNTAIGAYALSVNTSGANNTAIGRDALLANLSASGNTAVGYQAGYTGSTTANNAFVGYQAGYSVTTGTGRSVFLGAGAGFSTTSGIDNVAVGMNALFSNQIGGQNVVIGSGEFGIALHAGYYVTGSKNTLIGYSAGNAITTGSKNTIIGGYNGNQGGLDIRTADNRIVLSDGDGNPRGIFDSSGNFGIGTTSPRAKFEVNGVGSFGDGVAATPTITFGNELTVGMFRAGNAILGFSTGSTERMRIDSSGIVTMNAYGAGAATFSSAGVISSVSDETWKVKDGVPTDPDAMLKKLEPGYWYYNDEKKEIFGTERQLGFYAQNVNAAIGPEAAPEPETITTKNKDGIETTVTKPWGYYDRSVLAITVMSLQKALATIETLTDRITALETA